MTKLAYHELMGQLGVGDLHPGGREVTAFLLDELRRVAPRRVLEIGAGMGETSKRMVANGWQVVAVEPSVVLRRVLARRPGVVSHESFDAIDKDDVFDAVIGEGVLYGLDPAPTASLLHRVLRPGGLLAFTDMIWTDKASADVVAYIHHQTAQVFGIPMVPPGRLTWPRWKQVLANEGFDLVVERRLETVFDQREVRRRRGAIALGLVKHPTLIPDALKYQLLNRVRWAPADWLESWASVWRRA